MIDTLYQTDFEVWRNTWTKKTIGEKEIDYSEEVEIGSFVGYRQQAYPEYVQSMAITFSKPHIVWCSIDEDVQEGDILKSEFGTDIVRGKQVNLIGNNQHIELAVEHTDDNIGS